MSFFFLVQEQLTLIVMSRHRSLDVRILFVHDHSRGGVTVERQENSFEFGLSCLGFGFRKGSRL